MDQAHQKFDFCGNAGGAGFLERKLGVCAKGKQFFAALKAIFYAPAFCASWPNEKEQAVAVKQLLRFSSGLATRMAVSVRGIGVFSWQGVLQPLKYP